MTIKKAMEELLNSENFKADAREQTSLRMFASRYNHGTVGPGAAVDMLLKYGYSIEVKGRKKIVKRKG